jgi:hypothetical protein
MLTKLADIYNRQDIVDAYKYGVFNYLDYFDLLSRFQIDEYKSYQLRIIKRRSYIINRTALIEYCIDNKTHRDDDKPAIEWVDGTKSWWQYNNRHRDDDKPAVEYADDTKYWYQNGKCHRDNDKPAVEYADGSKDWYLHGEFIRHSEN